MNKAVAEWYAQAEYDLDTARAMLKTGRYIYVIFMCHLALEKALKGLVLVVLNEAPPKTHNLLHLYNITKPSLNRNHLVFISTINTASVVTRYPEELCSTVQQYTSDMASNYLAQTEEIIKCLLNDPRLNL